MCINKAFIFTVAGIILAVTVFTFIYVSSENLYKEPSNEGTFVYTTDISEGKYGYLY